MESVDKLILHSKNVYLYHSGIYDALVHCVTNDIEKHLITRRNGNRGDTASIFLTKDDWELAYLKCKRFFDKCPNLHKEKLKVLETISERIYNGLHQNNTNNASFY